MSVLAVVSKAVFEKEARVGGVLLGLGATFRTSVYASANPALEALREGGDLYLVTVRPGDVLWLVGILRGPKGKGGSWRAKDNATPIGDITTLIPKLRFESGKGLTAAPGKLGMSLQTPRDLADGDVVLLEASARGVGSSPPTPAEAYASVLAETPVMHAGAEYARRAAEAEGLEGSKLRLAARRAPWKALTRDDRRILAEVADEIADDEARPGVEVLDVVDLASGERRYLFALWPFGSGVLVDVKTKELVADVVQHSFDLRKRVPGLRACIAAAWHRDAHGLGVHETVSFEADEGVDEDGEDDEAEDGSKESSSTGAKERGGPLDVPVAFEGETRTAARLVSDAVHEARPVEAVLDALLGLGVVGLVALWGELARLPPQGDLTGGNAKPPKGAEAGSPAAYGAHAERWVRFLTALGERIGGQAEAAAQSILKSRADWVKRNRPSLEKNPSLSTPFWLEQCVALALLAHRAQVAGSALDASHDERLAALALSHDASYALPPVLEALPKERAGKIACAQIGLVQRFPIAEGAAAAIALCERWGGGPYYEKKLTAALAAIGPDACPAIEAALAKGSPQDAVLRKMLTKLGKAGKKLAKPKGLSAR